MELFSLLCLRTKQYVGAISAGQALLCHCCRDPTLLLTFCFFSPTGLEVFNPALLIQ